MHIQPHLSDFLNPALTDTAASFDPQLPLSAKDSILPPGIVLLEGGGMRLNFFAGPGVSTVCARVGGVECALTQGENGVYSAEFGSGEGGFCPVAFFVDGAEVLNPLAPIGFGWSHPINYADIPQENADFLMLQDVPHGAVTQEYYYSKAAGNWKSCLVYTPPGYMKDSHAEYPVLYLQHGHGENEQCWVHQGRTNFILDNLIALGEAVPFLVVMNNGMVQRSEHGIRTLDTALIEPLLIEDCIPFIERTYRAKQGKWHRAMAGLSMGSMQTSVVTLNHPDLFGYVGIFSGFVRPLPFLMDDDSHLAALEDRDAFRRNFRLFFRACGDHDDLALQHFEGDSALLAQKGLAPSECPSHEEIRYPGGHEWNVWRLCLRDFARKIFHDT